MTAYNDPQEVHSGECRTCGTGVRDADTMEDGECIECQTARLDDEESDPDEPSSFFSLACQITGAA